MDATAITAIGGIFTGLVIVFLKFVNDNRKSQDKRDEMFATALTGLTDTGKEQVKSSNKVAIATERSARESKQRNGHLAEIATENNKNNLEHNTEITKVLSKINDAGIANAISSAEILQSLKDSNDTLVKNTKLTLEASEKVAAALLVAAKKVESTPLHIDTQTVDTQTIARNVTT